MRLRLTAIDLRRKLFREVRLRFQQRAGRLEFGVSGSWVPALLISLALAQGCANFHPDDDGGVPVTTVACARSFPPTTVETASILDWQLTVVPDNEIRGGESFSADLSGVAVFPESFLDEAQRVFPRGVLRVNLVDLKATVHIRSGAAGEDVTLTADEEDYECAQSGTACDPEHDLEGVAGARANTDCEPQSASNPCGRFIFMPIDTDCDPGGVCDEKKKTGPGSQCDMNGFCITGDLKIDLRADNERYTAESDGDVLFGWSEGEDVGATIRDSGPNEGTWILPEAIYEEPTGPVGLRVTVGGVPIAFECTMGVDSRGPLGVDSLDLLSSRTPNSALVSFPIQEP